MRISNVCAQISGVKIAWKFEENRKKILVNGKLVFSHFCLICGIDALIWVQRVLSSIILSGFPGHVLCEK